MNYYKRRLIMTAFINYQFSYCNVVHDGATMGVQMIKLITLTKELLDWQ